MVSYHLRHEGREVEIDGCLACRGLFLDSRKARTLAEITAAVHDEMAMPGAGKGPLGVMAMYLLQVTTLMPSKVHAPLKRKTVLVPIAIALMTVVFAFEMLLAVSDQVDAFLRSVAFVPRDFARGENLLSVATYSLLHGGVAHLLGNMYTLYVFGENIEDILGGARAALVYWASAIAGGLLYFVLNAKSSAPLVGASGAIAGLMGAYLVLLPRVKLWLVIFFVPVKIRVYWYMGIWFLLQFVIMADPKSRVAWEAHVGGFIAGASLAFLLRKRETPEMPPSLRRPAIRPAHR
ncbi:MAG: rhomboid family intramembrane serine protease [Myxococcales bacterium]|nr:rhomboid family intramembrane serine protease [Myxococcales bacterium]